MCIPRVFLLSLLTICLAPPCVLAEWVDFVPRPLENGSFVDVYSSYERDHLSNGTRRRWDDTFVREKLTVYSNGYSYHPRFLLYQFSLGGAAKQEDYESSLLPPQGWKYGSSVDYDARLHFLPEHPYNLHLFSRRYEPLFKEQAATQHSSVGESHGVSFRYREKPYFLHTGFVDDRVESSQSSSDVMRFNLDGEYFRRFTNGNEVSFNGAFNPSWFSNSAGLDGSSAQYLLGNFVNLQSARLTSTLTKNDYDQESDSTRFENDQLALYELLSLYLPWSFRSNLSYRYQENEGKIRQAAAPTRERSDTGQDLQFDVIHRLYQSLDTTYTFRDFTRTSSGGDTTTLSNALAINYTKLIPRGRFLAGGSVARGDTANEGQADVVSEPYSAISVPGSFTLRQQDPDPTSIDVFLRSPLPPFETIRLEENAHYVVIPIGNTFEIQVFSLPSDFVVPGTYDFLVSYSLASGDFELRSDTAGANVSAQLFENLLNPYFSYVAVRSEVLSGVFPGIPVDSTTYTTGLLVYLGPLRLRGEYQLVEWETSPYEAWRAEAQFVANLNPTTSAYATTSYVHRHYSVGTGAYYSSPFDEDAISGAGSIQKQLLSRNLHLSAGGSWTQLLGRTDTTAYSGNAALTWKIGKVDLSAGATAYASDTSGGGTMATRRDHELFYLKLRRRLL